MNDKVLISNGDIRRRVLKEITTIAEILGFMGILISVIFWLIIYQPLFVFGFLMWALASIAACSGYSILWSEARRELLEEKKEDGRSSV